MPTPTYDLIASQVLSTSAASVTFSSIPATYRDLVVVVDTFATPSLANFYLEFNGDSSNYSRVNMTGDGSVTSSGTSSFLILSGDSYATNTSKAILIINIMDYSATDKHKTVLARSNSSGIGVSATAGRWASTAAINALEIYSSVDNFASGGTFYLYGIAS